jgi:hypothetical protein
MGSSPLLRFDDFRRGLLLVPLTFDDLVGLLTPASGSVTLTPGGFGAGPVAELLRTWFAAGPVTVTGAAVQADPARHRVTLTGALPVGSFLNATTARLSPGVFALSAEGVLAATLAVAVADPGWTLSAAFPALRGSVCDQLTYADPMFTLDSTGGPGLPAGFRAGFGYPADIPTGAGTARRGLALTTTVDLTVTGADLVATPVALSGPVECYPDPAGGPLRPQLLLAAPAGTARSVVVDGQRFTLAPQLACLLADQGVSALLALTGSWTGTGALPSIDLRGVLAGAGSGPGVLELDTGAPPLTPIGTPELPALLAGADTGTLLAPGHGFPDYQGLTLQRVALRLKLAPVAFDAVDALLSLAAPTGAPDPVWPLFGGLLTVHRLLFDADIARSGTTLRPQVAVTGSATLGAGGAELTVGVALPGLAVTGALAEDRPVDLTALVKSRLGVDLPLPQITSGRLSVTGDAGAGTWTIDAAVTQTWTLLGDPPDAVTLGDIMLTLSGTSDAPPDGSLTANLDLGGTPLTATAGYTHDEGWVLHAGLAEGAQADLAAVLAALAAAVGLPVHATLPSVVLSTLSLDYHQHGPRVDLDIVPADTGAGLLPQLAQALTGVADLPAIGLSEITASLAHSAAGTTVTLHVAASDWSIPLGPATLAVSGVAVGLDHTPAATTGTLTGTLAIAGVSAGVDWTLPGELRVTGVFPAVRLADLVATLTGNTLAAPAALDVTLPASTLTLTEGDEDFRLGWHTATSPLGELTLQVQRLAKAGWGIAAGFSLPSEWKLSTLSPALSTLDALTFDSAALVLSSFADPAFTFDAATLPGGVVEGLTFECALTLSGVLAGAAAMLGKDTVAVTAQIGPNPGATKLTAALGGTVAIPPTTNLLLGDLALSIIGDPLGVSLSGALTIPVGAQSLVATGRFTLTETAADFALDVTGSALSLAAPMGFRGVVLDELGVVAGITFEPPGLNLGLAGAFHLGSAAAGSDRFAFAFTVEGEAVTPTLLSAHLDELDLPTLFDACMLPTVVLPAPLTQVSFTDLTLYWCDTEQPLPDGSIAAPGYGISGAMAVFGWHAKVKLLMGFATGVHGEASCDPVNLGNGAFTLTGNGATGGPHVLVDTAASPYFDVSLDARLLDIVGVNVQGMLTASGLTFTLTNHLGTLDAALTITAAPSHASLASDVNCGLDTVVGPLTVPGTGLSLGRIHVQTAFAGSITMNLDAAGFRATIDGGFLWQGQHFQLATVTLTVTPADVAHIAQAVAQAVRDQAEALFGGLLSDAHRYFGLVSVGLVTDASDAGALATGVYHLTAEQTSALFKSVNIAVSDTVHTDVATGHVDTAPHTDVPAQHINTPPSHIDTPGAHTDIASTHADVPGSHADTTNHIDSPGLHTDSSTFLGHIDSTFPPHGDTSPHLDQGITPHGDTNGPHTDFAPHVDQTAIPHGDTDTPHVDAAPHTDTSPHVDTVSHIDT